MTACEQVHADLAEFLDETLPAERRDEILRHVEGCAACGVLLGTLWETTRLYRELLPWPLPTAVQARLEDLLRRVRREAEEDTRT